MHNYFERGGGGQERQHGQERQLLYIIDNEKQKKGGDLQGSQVGNLVNEKHTVKLINVGKL